MNQESYVGAPGDATVLMGGAGGGMGMGAANGVSGGYGHHAHGYGNGAGAAGPATDGYTGSAANRV